MPKKFQKRACFATQHPMACSHGKPVRPLIPRLAMHTSPHKFLLPLLIALGSTGLAETAIANSQTTSPSIPAPPSSTERPLLGGAQFDPQPLIDITNPNLRFINPFAQESTGTDGERTIVADGSEQRLNLSGQPGRNATEAGVRGRNGEPGGDGQNLTIYYTNPEHLRNIYVDAAGGPGGAGAPSSTERVCSTPESSLSPYQSSPLLPTNPPLTRQSSATPSESLIRQAPERRPSLQDVPPPDLQDHLPSQSSIREALESSSNLSDILPELQDHLPDQVKEDTAEDDGRQRRRRRRRGRQRGDGEQRERGRGRRGGEGRQERREGQRGDGESRGRRGGEGRQERRERWQERRERQPHIPAPSVPAPSFPDNDVEPRVDPPRPAVPQCYTTTIPAGSAGQKGERGRLRLINQPQPLPPEQPTVTLSLADLDDRTLDLSKHLWETRPGATARLAPGSTVADEYLNFVSRLEETVRLQWQASPNPVQSQVDQVLVSLNQQGEVELDFGSEVWVDYTSQRQDGGLEIAIAALVPVDDVTDMALGRVVTDDNGLNLQVIDRAGHADTLETTFHIHYRSAPAGALHEPRPRWQTRYEGEVPAELVTRDHNRFVIDLSQLPIEAQYQRSGTPVNIEITATRSLGDRAKTQTLRWQDQLR